MRAADGALRVREGKLRVVVGQDFAGTDPRAVRRVFAVAPDGVRWAWRPRFGIHHPKVYVFHHRDDVTALLGSANLTRQAFLYNVEATAVLRGDRAEMADVLRFFEDRWDPADEVTEENLDAYSTLWGELNQERQAVDAALAEQDDSARAQAVEEAERVAGRVLSWTWDEYVTCVHRVDELWRPFGSRVDDLLEMLEEIPPLLAHPLVDVSRVDRQALLGIWSEDYPTAGWLGTMRGAGHAKHLLVENDEPALATQRAVSKILQRIPGGDGLPPLERVRDAFEQLTALDYVGPAIASRYLTLLRPDACFSLNSASKDGFSTLLRLPAARLRTPAGYAEGLRRLWQAPWMSSPKPVDAFEAKLWQNRAALLDAFVYRPSSGQHPDQEWE